MILSRLDQFLAQLLDFKPPLIKMRMLPHLATDWQNTALVANRPGNPATQPSVPRHFCQERDIYWSAVPLLDIFV